MVMIQTLREPDPAAVTRNTKAWGATCGPVLIEALDCDTFLLALNQADADDLEAARQLGIVPKIKLYARDDAILPAGFDWFTPADWEARVAKWPGADPEDEDEPAPPRDHFLAGEVGDEIFEPGKAWAFEFRQIELIV